MKRSTLNFKTVYKLFLIFTDSIKQWLFWIIKNSSPYDRTQTSLLKMEIASGG